MLRRRRPLMRAAMVGGAAYYTGKKVQQGREREAEQDARMDELEAEQAQQAAPQAAPPPPPVAAAPAPAPAPAGGINESVIEQLKQLGELHDSGVLTDEEFAAQKAKLLG